MRRAHKQASKDNFGSKGSNYNTILSERNPANRPPILRTPYSRCHPLPSRHSELYLFPFVGLLLLLVVSVSVWLWAQAAGKNKIPQRFCSVAAAASALLFFLLPFSGASIISKQLSWQTMPSAKPPPTDRRPTRCLDADSLLNSTVCQHFSRMFFFFAVFVILFFVSRCRLMRFYLAARPTSFNKCQFAGAAAAKGHIHCAAAAAV